jgi:hypothetical protein
MSRHQAVARVPDPVPEPAPAPARAPDAAPRDARGAFAHDDAAFEELLPATPVACRLRITPAAATCAAILAGLAMLRRAGRIRLEVEFAPRAANGSGQPGPAREAAHPQAVLEVDGGGSSVIDPQEGSEVQADALAHHDLYFKRSFHAHSLLQPGGHKLRPLPLLDEVRTDFLHFDELRGEIAAAGSAGAKAGALARSLAQVAAARAGLGGRANWSRMHAPPVAGQAQRVLAIWRLQDPDALPPEAAGQRAARDAANRLRVECIRALRRAYGSRLHGGIVADPVAARLAPDLLLPSPRSGTRREFLRRVREHAVCVAASGPLGSNGPRLARFVAFSRAIVCEPLQGIVAGDFEPGRNYLEYETPEQCVARVAWLFDRPRERDEMARRNWDYYAAWQRPDRLALRLVALTWAARDASSPRRHDVDG